ncbi:MAG: hypothetical protein IKC30_00045 [Rikenellaceae bacterium]|nr:hypothetical protein [Rikenellaceae bacterium]
MKKENITFVSYASKMLADAEIRDLNYRLNSIRKALATKGEDTIGEFMAYQANPSHKRDKVLADCEAWMDASHCPGYLREENRQRAWHSCDNDFIAKIQSLINSLPFTLDDGDIIEIYGEWNVSQSLADTMTNKYSYTLTDEEMADFELYTQLVALATRLRAKNYYFDSRSLTPCDTNEQLAERMIAGKRATIEEITERSRSLNL